jgi:pheromone a factor receptor
LYHIACVKSVTVTRAEKQRAIMVDLAIGLGIPVLQMVIQYIPQGHRFNIYEDYGCYPWTYNTWVGIVLVAIWPIVIGCVSLVYCALTIRAFMKRRSQFKELLSGNSNLNSSRYLRLMILATTEIFCTIPFSSYFLSLNIRMGIQPWISWADTHSNFSRVDQVPKLLWERNHDFAIGMEASRWLLVACAVTFFAFFGFADEAKKNYRLAYDSVAKRVGYSTASMSSGMTSSNGGSTKDFKNSSLNGSSFNAIPRLEKNGKRASFDSFDAEMSLGDVGGFLAVKEDFSPTATSSGSSTAASSLPPSSDDTYSFTGSHPDASVPDLAANRLSVAPHSDTPSLSRAGSIDMV